MSSTEQSWEAQLFQPRDPLVFGDGGRIQAQVPRFPHLLPPQATVAGFLRTRMAGSGTRFCPELAKKLLRLRLRGPFLVKPQEDAAPALWLPAPSDVSVAASSLVEPKTLSLRGEEGVSWPANTPPFRRFIAPREKVNGLKTKRLDFPFWPFEAVVAWGLGDRATTENILRSNHLLPNEAQPNPDDPAGQEAATTQEPPKPFQARLPIASEHRIHVAINPEFRTAEPEALFNSGGQRYRDEFAIAVEISTGDTGLQWPATEPPLGVLGGEARVVRCSGVSGALFPAFDSVAAQLEQRMKQAGDTPLYLRLQLLTPGAFDDWQPAWPPELAEKLAAVLLPRHQTVSGWNLKKRGPRKVRRLVPAGALFMLGPFEPDQLLELCRTYWGASLCQNMSGDPASLLAPPDHDGYGLVLPLPWTFPEDS